jgi:hypothetical protein
MAVRGLGAQTYRKACGLYCALPTVRAMKDVFGQRQKNAKGSAKKKKKIRI